MTFLLQGRSKQPAASRMLGISPFGQKESKQGHLKCFLRFGGGLGLFGVTK